MKRNLFPILTSLLFIAFSPAQAEMETRLKNYTTSFRFGSNRIVDLAIDSLRTNKWAAVHDMIDGEVTGGIAQLDHFSDWSRIRDEAGSAYYGFATAIAADPDSGIWCNRGNELVKISKLDHSDYEWTVYDTLATGLPGDAVINDIAVDQDGVIWAATSAGLLRIQDDSTTFQSFGQDSRATCVTIGDGITVYCGTYSEGVVKYSGTESFNISEGEDQAGPVTAITVDAQGRLWFADYDSTESGQPDVITIYKYENGTLNSFSHTESVDDWFKVSDMDTDSEGNLWVATLGGGVKKYDGTSWISYTTDDGLADNSVNAVAVERPNKIWFGTDNGVSLLRFTEKLDPLALEDKDIISSCPLIDSTGSSFFGRNDGIFRAQKSSTPGDTFWTYKTGAEILSSPAVDSEGTFYFGSNDHFIYALNPDGTLKWSYQTGDGVISSPAVGEDGTIYVGSKDNHLYALNPDGSLKWRFETDGPVWSSPALGSDGTVYFGSHDKNFYALNPDGSLQWSYATGGEIFSSPAVGLEGTIYFGSNDHSIYALNPDGGLKWSYATGGEVISSPALDFDETVYVGSSDYFLYAITPEGELDCYEGTVDTSHYGITGYDIPPGSEPVCRHEINAPIWSSPTICTSGGILTGSCNAARLEYDFSEVASEDYIIVYTEFRARGVTLLSSSEGTSVSPTVAVNGRIYHKSEAGIGVSSSSSYRPGFGNTNWPKFRHDYRNTGNVATSMEIPIWGDVEKPVVRPSGCDINGDGRVSIVDVISLLLKARENPFDPRLDWDGNGLFNISDAILLITDIRKGLCPDAGTALASESKVSAICKIENLTPDDIEYLEGQLARMNLSEDMKAAFSLVLYGANEAPGLPRAFTLDQNMPNPFNPSTTITYTVPVGSAQRVTLEVFDLRGKNVRTLVDKVVRPGLHSVFWHGDDNSGRSVGSGVYFYRLRAGDFSQTRKMVMLK